MRLPSRGLFLELALAILVVIAVVFAVNAWFAIEAGRGPLLRLVEENLSFRTKFTLREIEKHVLHCSQEVDLWSKLDVLDDVLIRDRSMRIENLLLRLQREHPGHYHSLSVLDRSGTVLASTDVRRIETAIALDSLESGTGAGELRIEAEQTVLRITHPIVSRLSTEPIGWFVADVGWEPVQRLVSRSFEGGGSPEARLVFLLLDRKGQLLAGDSGPFADFSDRLVESQDGVSVESFGSAGTFLVARHHGVDAYGQAIPSLRVVGLWRQDVAHSIVRSFVLAVGGSTLLGVMLAAGASFVIARRITQRLQQLTRGTQRLAQGDMSYRVEVGRDDEIGILARSFNRMAVKLSETRDQLEDSVARWRAVVEHAPDYILNLSLDGKILFINRTVPGYTVQEVKGSNVYDYVPPGGRELLLRSFETVATTGQAVGLEHEALGPDGRSAWYSSRIGPILQEARVTGFTLIATDITERKRLERDILEVSELERKRIGQDLHDGLGQVLTGVSLLTRSLQERLAATLPDESAEARQIRGVISDAIAQTRSLARGLFPVGFEKNGLHGALEDLTASVGNLHGVQCELDDRTQGLALEASRAVHLFRIAQEAVSNSLRHGKARTILIQLTSNCERSNLRIEDDGVGLPDVLPERGMGLRLMKYRASMIGADIDLHRRDGGGTVVECEF